jgi:NAD(P)-dependent dehydrogenase (short-subunit alcohol dehydrogenase family)
MTVLVTGANSGIGYEAARVFARKRAQVVLACRDRQRGDAAAARICAETPGAGVEVLPLDLAKQSSVREAAKRFADSHPRLDILCNNAGVMAIPHALTEDGFEMQLGVNHFGHFALTGLLLGPLLAAPAARVVTVSSTAHRIGRMRLDDLGAEAGFETWAAYGQSKLANLLFAYALARRFESKGCSAISVACHPGYADTNLQQVGPTLRGSAIAGALMRASNALFAQSAEQGAWPTLYAATSPDVRSGDFIGPRGLGGIKGAPHKTKSNNLSHDRELADALWNVSVERTGVDFGALR